MATFIDLDSIFRDRETYPNENSYELLPKQVKAWFTSARTVRAYPQNPTSTPLEFATTVRISYLALPYTEDLAEFPRIYLNFESKLYKDIHLISAIDGKHPNAKFVCVPDRVQNDRNGDPLWIHYKCAMEQTMRFRRGDPIKFEITTRSDDILPQQDTSSPVDPDPTKQTVCTFEITPYIRDGDYTNNLLETHTT